MRIRFDALVLVAVCLGGCDEERLAAPTRAYDSEDPGLAQVTEQQRPAADLANDKPGAFGAECFDAEGCESRLCMHVEQSSRLAGRRCAQPCDAALRCERGQCSQVFPSDDGWFCLPETQ
jgi:hypothetical protein